MRTIPSVSAKLKALQDTIALQEERRARALEKMARNKEEASSIPKQQPVEVVKREPTIEDKYLMSLFESGRQCGD